MLFHRDFNLITKVSNTPYIWCLVVNRSWEKILRLSTLYVFVRNFSTFSSIFAPVVGYRNPCVQLCLPNARYLTSECCKISHIHTDTHTHTCTLTHTHSLSLTLTHTNRQTETHKHTPTHSHTQTLTHTQTNIQTEIPHFRVFWIFSWTYCPYFWCFVVGCFFLVQTYCWLFLFRFRPLLVLF